MKDKIYVREAQGPCEAHDWPTENLPRRLVETMRERRPNGINVCRECIDRAKAEADRERGLPLFARGGE